VPTAARSATSTKALAAQQRANAPTQQLIVQLKRNTELAQPTEADLTNLVSQWRIVIGTPINLVRALHNGYLILRTDEANADDVAAHLNAQANELGIAYAEPDAIFLPDGLAAPNDPSYAEQWHLQDSANTSFSIRMPSAWAVTTGTTQITIAMLDTGVLYNHPDLKHRLLLGYDFISDPARANDGDGRDPNAADPGNWLTPAEASSAFAGCRTASSNWHGTQMAGIIGAEADNGYGITGINWASPLLPVRVMGKCGGHLSDVVDGLRWAAGLPVLDVAPNPHPARVINLSFGALGACSPLLQNAIDEVTRRGVVVVTSAGNRALNAQFQSPANCSNVVVAGGVDRRGERGYYSNYGSGINVGAPGGDPANFADDHIVTTSNLGTTLPQTHTLGWAVGSSAAAAQVSGVISLVLSRNPNFTRRDVLFALSKTATPYPVRGSCDWLGCGLGLVNAGRAVSEATSTQAIYLPAFAFSSASGQNVIANGGFEAQANGWAVSSLKGSPVIMSDALMPPDVLAYSGNYAAWLGGVLDEVNAIAQSVVIPSDEVWLRFRWRLQSVERECGNDWLIVSINNTVVDKVGLCRAKAIADWAGYAQRISGLGGQRVMLQLQVQTNGSLSSSLFVDEVELIGN
jgi:serine protease